MLEAVEGELVEAGDGFGNAVKSLEETVNAGEFQSGGGTGGKSGEFDVAIALHSLFQAAQQDMDAGAVQMLELRAIKHQARPVGVQTSLQLAKKCPALRSTEFLRQLLHRYGSRHRRHDFPGPQNAFF